MLHQVLLDGRDDALKVHSALFDIEIAADTIERVVETVAVLQPTFGGINLEGIRSPECVNPSARDCIHLHRSDDVTSPSMLLPTRWLSFRKQRSRDRRHSLSILREIFFMQQLDYQDARKWMRKNSLRSCAVRSTPCPSALTLKTLKVAMPS
ncbi:MAG TPA: hypothetical protein VNJ49_10035 [Bradyrhizobium sp.]|nr:hypothetical protein [Bradyrhizobium sp.]